MPAYGLQNFQRHAGEVDPWGRDGEASQVSGGCILTRRCRSRALQKGTCSRSLQATVWQIAGALAAPQPLDAISNLDG
jgi:hypothetical protein